MNCGVYLHIPFCRTKCNYCHFVIRPWKPASAERYRKALLQELEMFFGGSRTRIEADSIYFGGGTPSLVPCEQIEEVLAACRRLFPVSAGCEISLEANPGTLSEERVAAYRELGINRVSIGAQSFDDHELAAIGRDHTGRDVDESVSLLRRNGIDNINLDIMLGLPGQTGETWNRDLERTAALAPAHVSVYMLDLDERSPLYHDVRRGRRALPEDDLISELYLRTRAFLAERGYEQYEISNFAVARYQCRHNLKYWLREPVLGFGVGSHSYDRRLRYANSHEMNAYLQAVESGRSPIEWKAPLEEAQALEETLFLGLRLNRGVDWHRVRQDYSSRRLESFESSLREMCGMGLVEWQGTVVRLTPQGMLLSNEVVQNFV